MSSENEGSLQETKCQLEMVETALASDPSNDDLLQLKADLMTLIQLLEPEEKSSSISNNDETLDKGDSKDKQEGLSSEELSKLEGMKVRASVSKHSSEFGNAVIISAEEDQDTSNYNDILVRLVFSHPTSERLVPCKYYLEGKCRRSEADCRWSHGEVRRLGDLAGYQEPDFTKVVEGGQVLVRGSGGVWTRARVTHILDTGQLMVKTEVGGSEPELKSEEEIYPLDDSEEDPSDDLNLTNDLDENVQSFIPQEIGASGIKFGDWENHTKGLGSKLMLKMGWVVGNGLGCRGGGRVEPVTSRMYPAGKSLDWCMEMRDKYGDNLGQDVEVIMKREAKEAQKRSKQVADAEERRDNSAKSLFDFINVNLGQGGSKSSSSGQNKKMEKKEEKKTLIKHESDQNLKLRQFKMSEQVSRLEKDISKLKESYSRHKLKDPVTAANIKNKIDAKTSELIKLQSASKSLSREEGNRKSKSKLSIF